MTIEGSKPQGCTNLGERTPNVPYEFLLKSFKYQIDHGLKPFETRNIKIFKFLFNESSPDMA